MVGAGPGGYPAAIRCAQYGLHTLLVERSQLGGVCLNAGCIPSKSLLTSAQFAALISRAATLAPLPAAPRPSYAHALAERDRTVERLRHGLRTLLRENGVELGEGEATLIDPHRLQVASAGETAEIEFDHCIIATGSRPVRLTVSGADLPGVIDSDGALALSEAPARAVVIGGGAIGVEWAEIWQAFGSEVTVLEALPALVPAEDPEIGRELARSFARRGIITHTGARVTEIRPDPQGLAVQFTAGGTDTVAIADIALVAVGRRPNVEGLGLERAGVRVEGGAIATDGFMRTSAGHIFAVGDVNGRSLLAHSATHQGLIAADTIAGRRTDEFDHRLVPGAIFTHPEIASVGLQEAEAVRTGLPVCIGRFPFAANARAVTSGDATGFVKVVAHAETHELLGVHIIGPGAADLIATASLALRLRARLEDLATTIHVHPTWSEALMEAAWAALERPIHVPRRRPRPADRAPA